MGRALNYTWAYVRMAVGLIGILTIIKYTFQHGWESFGFYVFIVFGTTLCLSAIIESGKLILFDKE